MRPRLLSPRQLSTIGAFHPCAVRPGPLRQHPPVRYLAARAGKEGDKSWGEILDDAAGVAKSVFNKIKDTAASLVPSPSTPPEKPAPQQPKTEAPLAPGLGGGLLPNLLGRAVGSLLSSAASSLAQQLEEAARAQAGAYEEAVARLQASAKLRARMGTVSCGPVMSQSSSSSSINGVVTKQVSLMLPVYGSTGGSGTAQVSIVEGPQQPGGRTMSIAVRTADGAVIVVDDGPSGGGGGRASVIDVEYREVKQ